MSTGAETKLVFLLDSNLGLSVGEKPWPDILSEAGIATEETTDLAAMDARIEKHEPDIVYMPSGDFLRMLARGDCTYEGLAIATSKFTGQPRLRALLVVRKDDEAESIDDLAGARLGYINRSCSSSYFPPAILLARQGKVLDDVLDLVEVTPGPTWQGLVDAVVDGTVRATMVLEDTWRATPENAKTTKVIADYPAGVGAIVAVRKDVDDDTRKTLSDALVAWMPAWDGKVYGAFKPYIYADVHAFLHDLKDLPKGA